MVTMVVAGSSREGGQVAVSTSALHGTVVGTSMQVNRDVSEPEGGGHVVVVAVLQPMQGSS